MNDNSIKDELKKIQAQNLKDIRAWSSYYFLYFRFLNFSLLFIVDSMNSQLNEGERRIKQSSNLTKEEISSGHSTQHSTPASSARQSAQGVKSSQDIFTGNKEAAGMFDSKQQEEFKKSMNTVYEAAEAYRKSKEKVSEIIKRSKETQQESEKLLQNLEATISSGQRAGTDDNKSSTLVNVAIFVVIGVLLIGSFFIKT